MGPQNLNPKQDNCLKRFYTSKLAARLHLGFEMKETILSYLQENSPTYINAETFR